MFSINDQITVKFNDQSCMIFRQDPRNCCRIESRIVFKETYINHHPREKFDIESTVLYVLLEMILVRHSLNCDIESISRNDQILNIDVVRLNQVLKLYHNLKKSLCTFFNDDIEDVLENINDILRIIQLYCPFFGKTLLRTDYIFNKNNYVPIDNEEVFNINGSCGAPYWLGGTRHTLLITDKTIDDEILLAMFNGENAKIIGQL